MVSIGIDIGKFSVKTAELETTSKGFTLIRTQEFPLSPDPTKDTRLEIVEILRNLATQIDPHSTRIVIGMEQDRVSVRQRLFPFKERYKVLKSLAYELEDDIPFSQEDAVFDAKITRFVGPSAEILAVASPKDHVSELLQLAHDGNIDPDIVSVDGLALANLFENWAAAPREDIQVDQPIPDPTPAEVVLQIGHDSTIVLIMKDGYLIDVRYIDWGGRHIAEAVAKKFNLHYVEGLKEARNKGMILLNPEGASRDQLLFSETIRSAVDRLAHELNLMLIDIQGLHHVKYSHMALLGGVGQLKNLGPYLTQKLEIACNKIKRLPFYPGLDFENNPNREMVSSLAIGLAIEGIKRPKNPAINLLRGEFAKQSQSLKIFWQKWNHALQVAAAAFVILLVFSILRDGFALTAANRAQDELREKAQNIAQLRGSQANARNARKYIGQQKRLARNRKMAEELQKVNSALEVINSVSTSTPGKNQIQINVLRLFVNNESVLLEGEVARPASISILQNALKSLAKNGRVQSVKSQFKPTQGWKTFGFRFRVDRTGGS